MNLTSKRVIRAYKDTLETKQLVLPCDIDLSSPDELPKICDWKSSDIENKITFPPKSDPFKDLYGPDGTMKQIYDEEVTPDWLTGFYLASVLIPPMTFGRFTTQFSSFHAGVLPGYFIKGFNYFCKNVHPYNTKCIKWQWYGTDLFKKKYLNDKGLISTDSMCPGIMKTGDISNKNNLRSWFNKFELNEFDVIFSDVKGREMEGLNLAVNMLKSNGVFIVRVSGIQVPRLASLIWKDVRLWRSPWGGRMYLICRNRKRAVNKAQKRKLLDMIGSTETLNIPETWLEKFANPKWCEIPTDFVLDVL